MTGDVARGSGEEAAESKDAAEHTGTGGWGDTNMEVGATEGPGTNVEVGTGAEPGTTAEPGTAAEPGTTGEGAAPAGRGTGVPPAAPLYKGEPLDAERGPGLGCFWLQVVVLGIFLILTPLTVVWGFPTWISATLLILTLVLVLFAGQTVIFLLRLVAADRRTRRVPRSAAARKTVGMIEEEAAAREPAGTADPDRDGPADDIPAGDGPA